MVYVVWVIQSRSRDAPCPMLRSCCSNSHANLDSAKKRSHASETCMTPQLHGGNSHGKRLSGSMCRAMANVNGRKRQGRVRPYAACYFEPPFKAFAEPDMDKSRALPKLTSKPSSGGAMSKFDPARTQRSASELFEAAQLARMRAGCKMAKACITRDACPRWLLQIRCATKAGASRLQHGSRCWAVCGEVLL